MVSWGRTLELMSAASLDVCEWLETTNSRREESDGGTQKYDLLLIGPAASHRQQLKTKVWILMLLNVMITIDRLE